MFLIVQSRKGRWGFPKGHAETVDDSEQAVAYREFYEETGIASARIESITEKRWTFVYDRKYTNKPPKQIFFWMAKLENEISPSPQDAEIQDAKWVAYDQLLDRLNRPGLKNGFLTVWKEFFFQIVSITFSLIITVALYINPHASRRRFCFVFLYYNIICKWMYFLSLSFASPPPHFSPV